MNRAGVMLLVVLVISLSGTRLSAAGIAEVLTAAEMEAALAYGKEGVGKTDEEVVREWLVDAPDGSGAAIIKTPFLTVALHARQALKSSGQPLSQGDLDALLFQLRALRETVNVEVVLFQKAEKGGADYQFRLVKGGVEQAPISIERKTAEPESGLFETHFDLYFQRPELAGSLPARLVVIEAGRPKLSFPLDLSKVR